MTDEPPGRGLATRRAVAEVVRRAALGSYGVIDVRERHWWQDVPGRLGLRVRGVRVRAHPALTVELHLRIALGVPIAEVARNVEAAVRYTVRTSLGRETDALQIHVDGVRAARRPRERDVPPAERLTREVPTPRAATRPVPDDAGDRA